MSDLIQLRPALLTIAVFAVLAAALAFPMVGDIIAMTIIAACVVGFVYCLAFMLVGDMG